MLPKAAILEIDSGYWAQPPTGLARAAELFPCLELLSLRGCAFDEHSLETAMSAWGGLKGLNIHLSGGVGGGTQTMRGTMDAVVQCHSNSAGLDRGPLCVCVQRYGVIHLKNF